MLIALTLPGATHAVVDLTQEEFETLARVLGRLEPAIQNYDTINGPRYFSNRANYRVPLHIEFVLPHDWKSRQQIEDEEEAAKRQVNM